jgi:hypothetical protein
LPCWFRVCSRVHLMRGVLWLCLVRVQLLYIVCLVRVQLRFVVLSLTANFHSPQALVAVCYGLWHRFRPRARDEAEMVCGGEAAAVYGQAIVRAEGQGAGGRCAAGGRVLMHVLMLVLVLRTRRVGSAAAVGCGLLAAAAAPIVRVRRAVHCSLFTVQSSGLLQVLGLQAAGPFLRPMWFSSNGIWSSGK